MLFLLTAREHKTNLKQCHDENYLASFHRAQSLGPYLSQAVYNMYLLPNQVYFLPRVTPVPGMYVLQCSRECLATWDYIVLGCTCYLRFLLPGVTLCTCYLVPGSVLATWGYIVPGSVLATWGYIAPGSILTTWDYIVPGSVLATWGYIVPGSVLATWGYIVPGNVRTCYKCTT